MNTMPNSRKLAFAVCEGVNKELLLALGRALVRKNRIRAKERQLSRFYTIMEGLDNEDRNNVERRILGMRGDVVYRVREH